LQKIRTGWLPVLPHQVRFGVTFAEDLPMTDDDLDRSYSAMCAALANVGQEKSHLFLSMICLSLMARYERAEDVLPLIANVQAQCAAEVAEGG
jgi:hypothetical protein